MGMRQVKRLVTSPIPLLLEEGMNVRLLMFPDNDDPDSFSRKVRAKSLQII